MIKILGDKTYFYQWDLNQKLVIEDEDITEVHFCNRLDANALVCEVYLEDGLRLVNVPNILLQNAWNMKLYAVCGDYTKYSVEIIIMPRSKPDDYVYTETEVISYSILEDRLEVVEKSVDKLDSDVDTLIFKTNNASNNILSISNRVKALDERVVNIENEPDIDLTGYATEDYVDNYIDGLENRVEVLENKPEPEIPEAALVVNITADTGIYDSKYYFKNIYIDTDIITIVNAYNEGTPILIRFKQVGNKDAYWGILDIVNIQDEYSEYIIDLIGNIYNKNPNDDYDRIKINITYNKHAESITNISNEMINYSVGREFPNPCYIQFKTDKNRWLGSYNGNEEVLIEVPDKITELPWESITNKPFYNISGGVILEENVIALEGGEAYITTPFNLNVDETYIIKYNGIEYKCIASLYEEGGVTGAILGNIGAITGENIGDEPFILLNMIIPDMGIYGMVMDITGAAECVLSISQSNDTKYIDSEVLPAATETTKGGVIVGDGLAINDGVLSVSGASSKLTPIDVIECDGTSGTYEINGLNLKEMRVYIHTTAAEQNAGMSIDIHNQDTQIGYVFLSNMLGTSEKFTNIYATSGNGEAIVEATAPNTMTYGVGQVYKSVYRVSGDSPIDSIKIYLAGVYKFPVGSVIEIWGVSA